MFPLDIRGVAQYDFLKLRKGYCIMLLTIQTGDVVDELGIQAGYKVLREAGFEALDWNIDHDWNQAKICSGDLSGCVFEKSFEDVLAYYADEIDRGRI